MPSPAANGQSENSRSRTLQLLGIFSGLTAGAWLGAAEAPTKLVTLGLSPMVISLVMVVGVFLARWSLPALILGASSIRADARRVPHLILWAILAGCLWAVANTLTVYAIRDIGLSIAFPLWNSNSLLGILWGFLFFNELRGAGARRWLGVLGGTLVMCTGAAILAIASSGAHAPGINPTHGVLAALGAGVLWGTMYIPYRKAYLSGMNPLSFVTFFTIGELGTMSALSFGTLGSQNLFAQLSSARSVIFWLMLGGFIWVIGDLFQQYAAKYVGISRGIPLSNTNQLWGLLWGVLVFGELHGRSTTTYTQVIGGSLLMILGVAAIALSSASPKESAQWKAAALRESNRYALSADFVEARMDGRQSAEESAPSRGLLDWLFVALATAVFIYFASIARVPDIPAHWTPAIFLSIVSLILLAVCGLRLWRTTRFQ
ncbi:MAG TPA: GRP family sugar transporter [Candidatus Dormibacteraeota bacterium]|jgi:glucose uptake protein GlcU|nr:GRP family sugar transporter [Candidatus Dormibacteraeota bacterium]